MPEKNLQAKWRLFDFPETAPNFNSAGHFSNPLPSIGHPLK